MSIRYGNKIGPLVTRKSSFFKKDRFDGLRVKTPPTNIDSSSNTWTRPTDWLTMPTITSSEQKIALLMPVFPQGSNFLAFQILGAYTVDWGNGITENFASGVKAQHEYSYTDSNLNTTVTTDGYKMAVVTITPQAGQNITSVNFNQKYAITGSTFPDSSPILEIVLSCPNLTSITLGNATQALVFCRNLISFSGINMGLLTSFASLFANLTALQNVFFGIIGSLTDTSNMFRLCSSIANIPFFNTSSVTNMFSMFFGCASIVSVPPFNTSSVTAMNSTFVGCVSLISVPFFNTARVASMSSMFVACPSLTSVPPFNTSSVTIMNNMFDTCRSLKTVPLFNTSLVTNISAMFVNCNSLVEVPLFNTRLVTNISAMFQGCSSLSTVPLFNTRLVTNMSAMFQGCSSLSTVPLFDTRLVTNMFNMFSNCFSLKKVPFFDTRSVANMSGIFQSCGSLSTVPLFDTRLVTNMSSMFQGCSSLSTVPLFDTRLVTNMFNMFISCNSLLNIPLFNTSATIDMSNMFTNDFSLKSVPLFNTSSVTNMNSMFAGCNSLITVPAFNTANVASMTGMFTNCASLATIPLFSVAAGTTTTKFSTMFSGCISLTRAALNGTEYSISYSGCKLSKEELESIFAYLDTVGAVSQTITITGNWGAVAPIVLNGTSVAGGTTIMMASTTGINVGMQIVGVGSPLTTARPVTFTDAGDLVNLAAHGLSNGDEVSFASVTTTTGIVIDRIYYVINSAAGTFQVSATVGGVALALTTNGSGTLRYQTEVVSIVPNTSINVSRPMSSSGTNSLTFRQLKTGPALLKGWTVIT